MEPTSVIRNFRRRAKLSQTALAETLGVTQSAICQYEAGKRRPIPAVAEKLLAEARRRRIRLTLEEIHGIKIA